MRKHGKQTTASDYIWVGVFIAVALVVRIDLLVDTGAVIDADEAIVGLMAKHILEGAPWPIFYYGQAYMGSLEALVAAVSFSLFSISSVALKAVPLYFSLLLVLLVYFLARCFTDRFGARIAAGYAALGPSALTLWSTMARGGFIELVVIGTAALILAVQLLKDPVVRPIRFFGLGLILGLGWWVNNQILFYMAPIGLVFAVHFWRRTGFGTAFWLGVLTLIGFFIGGWPFWHYNLFYDPPWQSFWLFDRASSRDTVNHLRGFFAEALPIIFGARRFWSNVDVFAGATRLVYLLYGVVLFVITYNWLWGSDGLLRGKSRFAPTRRPVGLLLLFTALVPVIFSMSKFGWLSQAPRYLLPLYSVLPVLVGYAASTLRRSPYWGTSALSFAVVGLLFMVHLASNYANGGAIPGQPVVFRGERVAVDHSELYEWLRRNNYRHIKTNYWIGYRAAFETQEEITFSIFRGPQEARIPGYKQLQDPDDHGVYVLTPSEAFLVARGFAQLGLDFRMTKVSGYMVIDHVRPVAPRGEPLAIKPAQLTATSREEWLRFLVDGDLGTRWGSGGPQQDGMVIELSLEKSIPIVGIELDYGFWKQDVARDLTIEGLVSSGPGAGRWCVLFDTRGNEGLKYVLENERVWSLHMRPLRVSALRFVQHGWDRIFDWSMAELTVFGPDSPHAKTGASRQETTRESDS